MLTEHRGADRYRDTYPHVPGKDSQRTGTAPEAFGDLDGLCRIRAGQQYGEFLTAEPPDDVRVPDLLPELGGQALQNLVAGQVTMAVVHPLEVIDINQQQRQ